jgi:hypothetical protein
MRKEIRRAEVAGLAATHTQAQIAEELGISRSSVARTLLAMGVRTSDPRGRPRGPKQMTNCAMCGAEVILQGSHLRTHRNGGQVCCSYACVAERAREWALNYDNYRTGPEANRWKHGLYSNEAREARIIIAAINLHIKEGANQ